MMNDIYDVLVVGAGPAGLTAALYAGRAGKSVIVFEKEVFGGQITYSPKVENYPGIPEVSGNEFAETLLSQISALGVVAQAIVQQVVHHQTNGIHGAFRHGGMAGLAPAAHPHAAFPGGLQRDVGGVLQLGDVLSLIHI